MGEHRYFQSNRGEERLFHRTDDPHETRNLINELPDVTAARARFEEWMRSTPEAPIPGDRPQDADPETLENLRALGYIR